MNTNIGMPADRSGSTNATGTPAPDGAGMQDRPEWAQVWKVTRSLLVVWAVAVWALLILLPSMEQIGDINGATLHLPHMLIGLALVGAVLAAHSLWPDHHLLWFLGVLLMLAAFAAFLASAFFVVKYFVGGDMAPSTWSGEQWANAFLGLGITAVITSAQAFLYASGYKGPAALLATAIVVFFGLFSEISQSMEREDAAVHQRSLDSPVFQATLGSIQNLSTQAVVSSAHSQLAAAHGKLARHEAELAACKGKYNAAARIQRCEKYSHFILNSHTGILNA